MGRSKKGGGGMKGFVKQTRLAKNADDENDDNDDNRNDAASTTSASDDDNVPLTAPAKSTPQAPSIDLETETKARLRERHRKEMNAAKKEAAKLGKKKKQEAADLVESVRVRHERELTELRARDHGSEEEEEKEETTTETLVDTPTALPEKKSKAQKRREKETRRLEEREARIREDLAELGVTQRESEEQNLKERLEAIGYCIYEIRPDGHCLFKAIEDQLTQLRDVTQKWSFEELRKMAAEELQLHSEKYLPFYVQDATDVSFLEHCENIASTAEWGGELEIQALSERLRKRMIIYSVDLGEKVVGESYEGLPIRLCFMKHAYHLGAHYNSVRTKAISIF